MCRRSASTTASKCRPQLVVMAVGIRPNTALAEASGIHCNRGIVVNDTMQTYDPRIYAVGECVNHRGTAYGLVAPLFEMAKVAANHLASFGIGRYQGSVTSTKLKVTGIDLFSAGEFMGGEGTEEIVLSDPIGGVYKKLVLKDDKLVGACLYGDTVDGSWYFKLLREGRDDGRDPRHADVRRIATSATPATRARHGRRDAGRAPKSAAATASARAPSSRRSRTGACSRWKKCASTPRHPPRAARAPAWSSRSSCSPPAATTRRRPRPSRCAAAPTHAPGSARCDPRAQAADRSPTTMGSGMAHANGCATLPPGAQLLPDLDLAA